MPPFALQSGLLVPSSTSLGTGFQDLDGRYATNTRLALVDVPEGSEGIPRQYTYAELYRRQPALFAVLNKLVRALSRVPVRVYRPTTAGGLEIVKDPEHSLVRLISRPAPRKGTMALVQWLMFPLLLHGSSLTAKYKASPDEVPSQLMPLQWPRVQGYRMQGGWIDRWIASEDNIPVLLHADEVIHTAWMGVDGVGGEIGISPLEPLAQTLAIEDAAQRHQASTFRNSARPEGVFTLPQGVTLTEQLEATLRASIKSLFSGVDNAAKTAILAGGAEWKATGLTAVETALLETRALTRLEVCIAFDVSPTVIGDLEHASQRGNIADLTKDFYLNTLGPWMQLAGEALQCQLVDPEPEWAAEGLKVMFDPSEFVRGDPLQWANALNARVAGGGLTYNERRDLDDLPRFDNPLADEPMVADNNLHVLGQPVDDGTTGRV